jgi:hypothetical protein
VADRNVSPLRVCSLPRHGHIGLTLADTELAAFREIPGVGSPPDSGALPRSTQTFGSVPSPDLGVGTALRLLAVTTASLSSYSPVDLASGANVTRPKDIIAERRGRMVPSSFHSVGRGTAATMPRNWGGVVDEQWKVFWRQGLDCDQCRMSIMPDRPGAYTQQTVYAMADKGGGFDQAEGLIKGGIGASAAADEMNQVRIYARDKMRSPSGVSIFQASVFQRQKQKLSETSSSPFPGDRHATSATSPDGGKQPSLCVGSSLLSQRNRCAVHRCDD